MRNNDSIKIQINSVEALERLLGDDPQLDIEVRNNVIQRFAETHLKKVANSEMIRELEHKLKSLIWDNSGYNRKLNPEFEKKITAEADKIMSTKFQAKFDVLRSKHETAMNDKYNEFADKYTDSIMKSLQSEKLEQIINARVNAKFKTMLKLIEESNDSEQTIKNIDDLK